MTTSCRCSRCFCNAASQFGKEFKEVFVEIGAVKFDLAHGLGEVHGTAESMAHATQGLAEPGHFAVGAEPIFRAHPVEGHEDFRGEHGAVEIDLRVEFARELLERSRREVVPSAREEMVVGEVDDDAAVALVLAAQSANAASHDRMGIGEGIDDAMAGNAALEGGGQGMEFARREKVWQEIAETELRVGFGEDEVREPIHAGGKHSRRRG